MAYCSKCGEKMGEAKGHLGAGSVDLNCTHFEEKTEEKK